MPIKVCVVTKLSIPDFRLPLSLLDSTPRSALVDLELRAVNPSLVLLQSTGDVGFPVPVAARVIPVTNGAPAGDSSPLSTHFCYLSVWFVVWVGVGISVISVVKSSCYGNNLKT